MVKVLAFAGSTRKGSFNQAVIEVAAQGAREAGADVTLVNLADFDMPIFNQDIEAERGAPESVRRFKQLMFEHDALLIATPEYNSSYPALLKNVIDWASRSEGDETPLQAFKGKVAGIMAASPGALGGMRVLVVLRMLLGNIGVTVLPNQKAVGKVHTLLDDHGKLADERTVQGLKALAADVVDTAQKLK